MTTETEFTPCFNKETLGFFLNLHPEFYIVIRDSLHDDDLMQKFSKLTNTALPKELTPIEIYVDLVSGHVPNHDEFCIRYFSFLYEIVWSRLDEKTRNEIKAIYKHSYLDQPHKD